MKCMKWKKEKRTNPSSFRHIIKRLFGVCVGATVAAISPFLSTVAYAAKTENKGGSAEEGVTTWKKEKRTSSSSFKHIIKRFFGVSIGATVAALSPFLSTVAYAAKTEKGGNAEEGVTTTLNNLATTSTNFFNTLSSYTWILIAAALVICGGLYLVGGEEGKQRANKWVPRILIGTVLILGAVSIAKWIATDLVAF